MWRLQWLSRSRSHSVCLLLYRTYSISVRRDRHSGTSPPFEEGMPTPMTQTQMTQVAATIEQSGSGNLKESIHLKIDKKVFW